MASRNVIQEYLVGLGFAVDAVSLRKFEDSLKRTGVAAEKFAKTMAIDFTVAGGAVISALAAVGAGTVALATNVARQDLQFQIFARRMFMDVDAARSMKIALDALGYSIAEIYWGPPELGERYRQLILDQTNMIKIMGGDTGERAFRKIRDIEFQFTRMGPELVIFSRKLTEDLVIKLFGSMDNLENKLKSFNSWFQANIPAIADKISNVLVPAFKKLFDVAVSAGDALVKDFQFLTSPNKGSLLWDKDKSFNQNLDDFLGSNKDEAVGKAAAISRPYGPQGMAEFLALIQQESGFNPNAQNTRTGAFGLGQVMPKNWPAGKQGGSIDDQLAVAASIFFGDLKKRKGNVKDALHDYYGWGKPGPGEPTFEEYYGQWQQKYNKWRSDPLTGGTLQNQAYHSDMGGVTINITSPNATPEQIKKAVKEGIDAHVKLTASRSFASRQGTYA
jgi:hypothetical protein